MHDVIVGEFICQKYYKKITAKDSVRDCYFAVRGMQTQKEILTKKFQNQSNYKERLSSLLNDTSDQSIQNAGRILSKIKDNVYSFETIFTILAFILPLMISNNTV